MIKRIGRTTFIGTLLAATLLAVVGGSTLGGEAPATATAPASKPAAVSADWPQWRGPNRDGMVVGGPKLLDEWPKEGPPLVWKSEFIPSHYTGNCSSPVVADGKVFLYVSWRHPVKGGQAFKLITPEWLEMAGWLPDLPDALAKKFEEARLSKDRPTVRGAYPKWWKAPKEEELDAFLAKNEDLEKYIKTFIATLEPADAKKYGAYIKRRFTAEPKNQLNNSVYSWDDLVKLSTLRDTALETEFEWVCKKTETLGYKVGWYGRREEQSDAIRQAAPRFDTVICLDAATGKTLWKKEFPSDSEEATEAAQNHRYLDPAIEPFGVCATPAIWDGKVYAAGVMGFYCLSVKDGSLLWQAKSAMAHSSPLVAKGVAFNCNSAYNATTGELLWKIPRWHDAAYTRDLSPALWTKDGKDYIIAYNGTAWCALEIETGKVLWTIDCQPRPIGTPLVRGDSLALFVGAKPRDGLRAYTMSPAGVELLWTKHYANGDGVLALWQNNLLILSQAGELQPVTCLACDLKTGEEKWTSAKIDDNNGQLTQPICADGKLFNVIGNCSPDGGWTPTRRDSDHLYKLEMASITPEWKRLGKFDPGICAFSSPALADGRLFLRLEKGMACYDLRAKKD